ncbi:MAG: tetraacyldisaccharide 4'-kinase [Phycisphaerales bacterium]|nr:tetraacyldisaccharide 4'-kinase [Phycisphaerales bacterium]
MSMPTSTPSRNTSTNETDFERRSLPAPDHQGLIGFLRRLLSPIAGPFYAKAVARRNRAFDRGEGVWRAPIPVISVGNLSTGGTGKTPMVAWVCKALTALGYEPLILTRGYKATKDHSGVLVSDEAAELQRLLPSVRVVVNPDRCAALRQVLSEARGSERPPLVAVMDDGYQHRALGRELDIVLVDATRSPLEDRLLPGGNLREPLTGLSRAGAVVITRGEVVGEQKARALDIALRSHAPRAVFAISSARWSSLRQATGIGGTIEQSSLRGAQALLACGLGNPASIEAMLREHVGPEGSIELFLRPDHDPFTPATVEALLARAKMVHERAKASGRRALVVTTEKDWSKLSKVEAGRWPEGVMVVVPRVEPGFTYGEADLLSAIARACASKGAKPKAGS